MALVYMFLSLVIASVNTGKVLAEVRDNDPSNSIQMVQSGSPEGNSVINSQDSGHLESCLGVKGEIFNITWTPKIFKADETVVFFGNGVTTQEFNSGKVCLKVWLNDIPDPIYDFCKLHYCADFLPVAQPYLPKLTCPIPKGFEAKVVLPVKIVPTIPLPAGTYRAKTEAWNENNVLTICCSGTIEIEDE